MFVVVVCVLVVVFVVLLVLVVFFVVSLWLPLSLLGFLLSLLSWHC